MGTLAFVLGLLVGLGVGALAVWGAVRSVSRITGSDGPGVLRLIAAGLRPGPRTDGVAAQRALARRLQRTGERTASGRRVAASEVELHVAPEDFALIDDALGIERATDDLLEFYRGYASRNGWLVQGDPVVSLVRDISLRPRQSFARATTRAAPRDDPRPRTAPVEAVTDVIPRGDEAITRVYPPEELDVVGPGDLVVVHGTDVRTIPADRGRVAVGRGPHNDIVIDRPSIARDHVVVERREDAWWVVPGTAQTGTVLDGRRIDAATPIEGQALLELGRGVRVRLSVEPVRAGG